MLVSRNFELINIEIDGAVGIGSKVNFGKQDQIQTYVGGQVIFINALEVFCSTDIALSPIDNSNPLCTRADLLNTSITIVSQNRDRYANMPSNMLHRLWQDTAAFVPFTWQPLVTDGLYAVDWAKCYITWLAAPAATPSNFIIGVHYSYVDIPSNVRLDVGNQ